MCSVATHEEQGQRAVQAVLNLLRNDPKYQRFEQLELDEEYLFRFCISADGIGHHSMLALPTDVEPSPGKIVPGICLDLVQDQFQPSLRARIFETPRGACYEQLGPQPLTPRAFGQCGGRCLKGQFDPYFNNCQVEMYHLAREVGCHELAERYEFAAKGVVHSKRTRRLRQETTDVDARCTCFRFARLNLPLFSYVPLEMLNVERTLLLSAQQPILYHLRKVRIPTKVQYFKLMFDERVYFFLIGLDRVHVFEHLPCLLLIGRRNSQDISTF